MVSTALPRCGYSIPEIEQILNIPQKTGYKLIKENKISAFEGLDGKLKVSELELYFYMRQQQ